MAKYTAPKGTYLSSSKASVLFYHDTYETENKAEIDLIEANMQKKKIKKVGGEAKKVEKKKVEKKEKKVEVKPVEKKED